MSSMILLESIIKNAKDQYWPDISDDELFEIYSADNILVNYDLDSSEIESGIIDGPRDAGIDAAYVFINGQLLTEDFEFSTVRPQGELELFLLQVKNQDSFKEGPLDKLAASLPLLLGYHSLVHRRTDEVSGQVPQNHNPPLLLQQGGGAQ
jgi:hypothetical protein